MAHYSATVTSDRPADEVFAYLADFRSVAEWDPSITASVHINGDDPIKVGAIFQVTTNTTLNDVVLSYETIELNRPHKIVLRGENDSMISIDTITIQGRPDGGAEVTYDAEIGLKGVRKLADPVMQLGLNRLGAKARQGLEEKLNRV
jgi:uncharacterized protein YndB with AHSA1/START domain